MFIRKRDPRYKAHLKTQSQPPTTLPLPNLPARQPASVYIEQEWQKTNVSGVEDLDWALVEGNDDPEVFECVTCGKSFKSEAAWNSHERSRKHIKNVEVLRHQMVDEAMQLGLSANMSDESGPESVAGDEGLDERHETPDKTEKSSELQTQPSTAEEPLTKGANETEEIPPQEQKPSKRDKRRLREAKKQAQVVEDAHVSDW